MASKRNPSDPSGPSARQPRRPPTIELEASEVSADPILNPSQSSASGPASDAPPDASDKAKESAARLPSENSPWLKPGVMAMAGVLLAFALLWWTGLLGGGTSSNADRLAAIEAQLRELAARPAPVRDGSRAIEELNARLSRLESAAAAVQAPLSDAALANRLASAENATKTFADDIGSLNRRTDDLAATVRELRNRLETSPPADKTEIENLSLRITALERAAGTIESELGKRATVASDRAVRLALATSALRAAVERGEPFTGELAAARPLAGANALAGLEPFAATGVPSNAALARELSALVPALRRAVESAPPEGGFFDRLWANAGRLVRIRPAEETAGDSPSAVVSRIDLKAANGDVMGALADLEKLPPSALAPAQAWIDKVHARIAAVEASRKLTADAINALGRVTP